MNRNVIALLLATFIVIVVAILGFHALGGPSTQRAVRTDMLTLQRISAIAAQLHVDRNVAKKIPPDNLDGLPRNLTEDPITHQRLAYRRISDTQYQLCATFLLESKSIQGANPNDPNNFWYHPKGYYCYQIDTTQQLQPFFNFGSGPFD